MPPPMIIATAAPANPTSIDTRAPAITSESMSMPPSSRPSRCWLLGGAYTGPTCVVVL